MKPREFFPYEVVRSPGTYSFDTESGRWSKFRTGRREVHPQAPHLVWLLARVQAALSVWPDHLVCGNGVTGATDGMELSGLAEV